MNIQGIHKLSPPGPALGLGNALEVVFSQFTGQVEESHGNSLRLPLKAQHCAETKGGGGGE